MSSLESRLAAIDSDPSLDWISAHSLRHEVTQNLEVWREAQRKDQHIASRLAAIEERLHGRGGGEEEGMPPKKRRKLAVAGMGGGRTKEEKRLFAELFPEGLPKETSSREDETMAEAEEDDDLLVDVERGDDQNSESDAEDEEDKRNKDEEKAEEAVTKIFFCSRTHSQVWVLESFGFGRGVYVGKVWVWEMCGCPTVYSSVR